MKSLDKPLRPNLFIWKTALLVPARKAAVLCKALMHLHM